MKYFIIILLVAASILPTSIFALNPPKTMQNLQFEPSIESNNSELEAMNKTHDFKFKTFMVISVLAGLISISLLIFFATHKTLIESPAIILNTIGLVMIIYASVALSIVAETDQQLTASIGIIGAIAGYLFGTIKNTGQNSNPGSND